MVLLLAVHTVETVTAKVPLSMIILNDYIKRRTLPPGLKCRMVQEDFSFGIAFELGRARASEKVAAGGRSTLNSINQAAGKAVEAAQSQLDAFDTRTNILTATKEGTSAAYGRMRNATERTLENETVSAALTKASSAFSWLGRTVMNTASSVTRNAGVNMQPPSQYEQDMSGSGGYSYAPTGTPTHQQSSHNDNAYQHSPPVYQQQYGATSNVSVPVSNNGGGHGGTGGWGDVHQVQQQPQQLQQQLQPPQQQLHQKEPAVDYSQPALGPVGSWAPFPASQPEKHSDFTLGDDLGPYSTEEDESSHTHTQPATEYTLFVPAL